MIRRAFVRALSGALFASLLGVKVETWKLEEPLEIGDIAVGVGEPLGESPVASALRVAEWSLSRDGKEWASGVGIETEGEGFILHRPTYWL